MVILFAFVLAQSLPLQITEIMYNLPGKDDGYEWVEVQNISSQTLFLKSGRSGWRLSDGANHLFKNDLVIQPNEIFVIVQDAKLFQEKYPNFNGKLVESSFSLKNSAGEIQIFDENKNLLADAKYQDSLGANGNDYSLVFDGKNFIEGNIEGGTPGEKNFQIQQKNQKENIENKENEENTENESDAILTSNEETNLNSTSTKNTEEIQENSTEQKQTKQTEINNHQIENNEKNQQIQNIDVQTLEEIRKKILWQNLFINEFLPNPEGKDSEGEFIEIWNTNNEKVILDGLILVVGEKEIPLSGEINGKDFFVLTRKNYKFIIKNTGDKISLQTIDGKLIHQISFVEQALEGLSFARFADGWQWTLPSPGKENKLIKLTNEENTEIQSEISQTTRLEQESNLVEQNKLLAKINKINEEPKRNYLIEFILPLIFLMIVSGFIFWKYFL